jgi:transcriptional regulator with XRE-family HTH domain
VARLAHLLARNIATVRRAAGLRQRDLADRVGLTLNYIRKIEQERKVPTSTGRGPRAAVAKKGIHPERRFSHAA